MSICFIHHEDSSVHQSRLTKTTGGGTANYLFHLVLLRSIVSEIRPHRCRANQVGIGGNEQSMTMSQRW